MKFRMTPEHEEEYTRHIAIATDEQMQMGRTLQKLAFTGEREYDDHFIPAPIYLKIAMNIPYHQVDAIQQIMTIFKKINNDTVDSPEWHKLSTIAEGELINLRLSVGN